MSGGTADIEVADRMSWKRVWIVALAAAVFLLVQMIASPAFPTSVTSPVRWLGWGVNVVALLLILATGGGLLNRRALRRLINDEISRAHQRHASAVGFWTAMMVGLMVSLGGPGASLTSRQAAYLVVTAAVVVATGTFSLLEFRAHADA